MGLVGGEKPVAEVGTSSLVTLFLDDSRMALFAGIGGLPPCRLFPAMLGPLVARLALSRDGSMVADARLDSCRLPEASVALWIALLVVVSA
jgi:hypothetical protein